MNEEKYVAIDFETYYDSEYSLRKLTPYEYVRDGRFDPYLVACSFSDGRDKYVGDPLKFDWESIRGYILLAHNAAFDGMVVERLIETKKIPDFGPRVWKDTADLAAFLGVTRNLQNTMKQLFNRDISKEVRSNMLGRHMGDLSYQEQLDLVAYGASDADECLEIWMRFKDRWPEIEQKISEQHRNAAWLGINVNKKLLDEGISKLNSVIETAKANLPWMTGNVKDKAGSRASMTKAVKDLGLPVPESWNKKDVRYLEWEKKYGDKCPFLNSRIDVASATPHLARLLNLNSHLLDGLYHSDLRYAGTHTLRVASGSFDSASKLNLLNMPKKPVYGVDIRALFVPRPGHKFVIYDYGQIEARIIQWLSGDMTFAEDIKREGNIYQAAAVKMGWIPPGSPSLKKTDNKKYQLAKACLTEDSLIFVKTSCNSTCYKRIIDVTPSDCVWDGHAWVHHEGVQLMRHVHDRELRTIGGVTVTSDHGVFLDNTTKKAAGALRVWEQTSSVAWGQSTIPVSGWHNVWSLAREVLRLTTDVANLVVRKAADRLQRTVHMHRLWKRCINSKAKSYKRKVYPVQRLRQEGNASHPC